MHTILAALSILIATQAFSAEELIDSVPQQNMASVRKVINYYIDQCSSLQKGLEKTELQISEDSIKNIKLLQGNTDLTVLWANFNCPGVGHFGVGSGGPPTYFIINEMIYEVVPSSPQAFNVAEDKTVLINWHQGLSCEALSNTFYVNARPCFSAIYWDHDLKTFAVFSGKSPVRRAEF